tara:strand:- start:3371 stop:4627 length:1257 start_codon:yes stop_codon:yes gene_type:complete
MNKIKVLHLIPFHFMAKVHATFIEENDPRFEFYWIYTKYRPNSSISFMKTGTQILPSTEADRKLEVLDLINEKGNGPPSFKSTIKFILDKGIENIILSNLGLRKTMTEFFKNHPNIKIYFINHGISNLDAIKRTIQLNRLNENYIWSHVHHTFITKTEIPLWKSNPRYICEENGKDLFPRATIIPGIPQMDFMKTLDFDYYKNLIFKHLDSSGFFTNVENPDAKSKKSILFVNNISNDISKCNQNNVETNDIFKCLSEYCETNDLQLFSKIKHVSAWQKKFRDGNGKVYRLFKPSHITPVLAHETSEIPLYYFLFADAIVVQNYGTSLIEALMVKPQVIRCQLTKADNVPLMNKYPNLLQAYNTKTIVKQLDEIFEGSYPTPEAESERELYLKDFLGDYKNQPSATKVVLDKIYELNQ